MQRNIVYYSDLAVNEWFRPWVKQQLAAKFWGGTLHSVPLGTKFWGGTSLRDSGSAAYGPALISVEMPSVGLCDDVSLSVCVISSLHLCHHQVRVNSVTSQWHCSDDHCHRQTEGIRPPWTSQQCLRLLFFTLDLNHISSSNLFHRRLHHRYSLDPFWPCTPLCALNQLKLQVTQKLKPHYMDKRACPLSTQPWDKSVVLDF